MSIKGIRQYTANHPSVKPGEVFTVEKLDRSEFQAVYPEALAEYSSVWLSEAAAWEMIREDCNELGIVLIEVL